MTILTLPHGLIHTPGLREIPAASLAVLAVLITNVVVAVSTATFTRSGHVERTPPAPLPSRLSRVVPDPRPQSPPMPLVSHHGSSTPAGRS